MKTNGADVKKIHDEIWALDPQRMDAFLQGRNAVVEPLPDRYIGKLRILQTRVVIEDEELYQKFRIQFLSAGG